MNLMESYTIFNLFNDDVISSPYCFIRAEYAL